MSRYYPPSLNIDEALADFWQNGRILAEKQQKFHETVLFRGTLLLYLRGQAQREEDAFSKQREAFPKRRQGIHVVLCAAP